MKTQLSLLALSIMAASATQAMQALDDSSMSDVTGQSGLTIEQTTTGHEGHMFDTGEIRYTQADTSGEGEAYLSIDGMSMRAYVKDENATNNFGGYNTIRRTIDINSDGDLSIKTLDIDTLDIKLGAVSIGGRRINSGIDINEFEFAEGSYLETEVLNHPDGAKVVSRNVMKEGTGYNQITYENDVQVSADTVYLPNAGDTEFVSETILTSTDTGLKLEVGETRGTIELQDFSILDENGNNLFGNSSFGDLGYGNISVNTSYITIAASQDPLNRNGLEGIISSDLEIGSAYFRTDNARLNANNIKFTTGGDLHYNLALMDNGYATGLEAQFEGTAGQTASLIVGGLTLSDQNGANESLSAGSFAISDLTLNGGTAEVSLYTLPGYGTDGLRQVVNATGKTSFDLVVYDDGDALTPNSPKISASIVMNNFTQDQTVNYTKKGIRTITATNSMDMNVNAIKVGNNVNYQGQSGRLVMNNFHQLEGGYTNIEPLN